MPDIAFKCASCGTGLAVGGEFAGEKTDCPTCGVRIMLSATPSQVPEPSALPAKPAKRAVRLPKEAPASVSEGALGTLCAGASAIPSQRLQDQLNQEAKSAWQVVFQVVEHKRFLIF